MEGWSSGAASSLRERLNLDVVLPASTRARLRARLDELGACPPGVDPDNLVERARWAREHGLLAPAPDDGECRRCGGAGFLVRRLPLGHPDYGRSWEPCPNCNTPTDEERTSRLWRLSRVPEAFAGASFATYQAYHRDLQVALAAVRDYTDQVAECGRSALRPNLVLLGNVGTGKTHLAVAAARRVMGAGRSVYFLVVPEYLQAIRETFGTDGRDTQASVEAPALHYDLLVLDDFGAERWTDWAAETLYRLVNHRYSQGLPTMVTTNCPEEDLRQEVPRIWSRLGDRGRGQVIALVGRHLVDYRAGRKGT